MKKSAADEKPVVLDIQVDKELDKRKLRTSQRKLDKAEDLLRKFPVPEVHKRNG